MATRTKYGNHLMRFSESDTPIEPKNKISFASFCKTVWQLSNTNLHYHDFMRIHEGNLKRMFCPEKLVKV